MRSNKEILLWVRDRIKETKEYIRDFRKEFKKDYKDRFYNLAIVDLRILVDRIAKLALLEELERFIKGEV